MTGHWKRNLVVVAVIILITAVSLSSFIYLSSQKPYSGIVESLTLGVYPSEYSSIIYIAKDQDYFSNNGLDITIKNYTSGSVAVRGMLNGEVDVATASEFVVVNNAMNNASIYAFGTISKYLNLYLVARSDKGINSISDIVGKRIGVPLGTANQFFLGRYMDLSGIKQNQVTLVNVNFAETPNAIANGTIDAAMTFQPYINQIQSLLGNKVVMWPAQADQFGYFESVCTQSWATTHRDLIVRFLKALVQAEDFNVNHRDQAIDLIAKDLNQTNSYVQTIWGDYQYSVTLDQSFILLMQDEARWLLSNNLTTSNSVPNLLNYIYIDGLKLVKPEAVNIIG